MGDDSKKIEFPVIISMETSQISFDDNNCVYCDVEGKKLQVRFGKNRKEELSLMSKIYKQVEIEISEENDKRYPEHRYWGLPTKEQKEKFDEMQEFMEERRRELKSQKKEEQRKKKKQQALSSDNKLKLSEELRFEDIFTPKTLALLTFKPTVKCRRIHKDVKPLIGKILDIEQPQREKLKFYK